jgi:hypothetical protein
MNWALREATGTALRQMSVEVPSALSVSET